MKRAARACLTALLIAPPAAAGTSSEALLNEALGALQTKGLDAALAYLDDALRISPNFRLAHLMRGDLLLAHARPLRSFGGAAGGSRENLDDLRAEALVRVAAQRSRPEEGKLPENLLQLDAGQRFAMVVDAERSRLYVFENIAGEPRLIADYYASSGKRGINKAREGDQKTPLGVYFVKSRLGKERLTDFYGSGAFPINYPNAWDRAAGRSGHGIWLHGTPANTYSRPPRASDGCVVLANQDLLELTERIDAGRTPIVIGERIAWLDPAAWNDERRRLAARVESWRESWQARDADALLDHYAARFRTEGASRERWREAKRRAIESKKWIRLTTTNLSLLRYSTPETVAVVSFDQDYRSDSLSNRMRKRQYWILDEGRWKIARESDASRD